MSEKGPGSQQGPCKTGEPQLAPKMFCTNISVSPSKAVQRHHCPLFPHTRNKWPPRPLFWLMCAHQNNIHKSNGSISVNSEFLGWWGTRQVLSYRRSWALAKYGQYSSTLQSCCKDSWGTVFMLSKPYVFALNIIYLFIPWLSWLSLGSIFQPWVSKEGILTTAPWPSWNWMVWCPQKYGVQNNYIGCTALRLVLARKCLTKVDTTTYSLCRMLLCQVSLTQPWMSGLVWRLPERKSGMEFLKLGLAVEQWHRLFPHY